MATTKSNKFLTFCLFQGAALVGGLATTGCDPVTAAAEVTKAPAQPELYIDSLATPEDTEGKKKCPTITTFACGEEPNGCSGC